MCIRDRDYYAPQTTQAPDGRRILIAWMKSWDTNIFPEGFSWNGMTTVPREVSIREEDGRILQNPVRELERYHGTPVCAEQVLSLIHIFGRWLSSRTKSSQVVISTKGCHPPLEDMSESRVNADAVRKDVRLSLKNLGCDRIDLNFLHRDDPKRPVGEILEALEEEVSLSLIHI